MNVPRGTKTVLHKNKPILVLTWCYIGVVLVLLNQTFIQKTTMTEEPQTEKKTSAALKVILVIARLAIEIFSHLKGKAK